MDTNHQGAYLGRDARSYKIVFESPTATLLFDWVFAYVQNSSPLNTIMAAHFSVHIVVYCI
jgi:hypothetical protein